MTDQMESSEITISVKLDRAVNDRLDTAARARGVGKSTLAALMIAESIDNLVPVSELRVLGVSSARPVSPFPSSAPPEL